MYHPIGSHCFPALINNCQWSLRQPRPAPAVFYTAKGRQFTGTTAGARNEQTQEALSFCKTNANFHILMVVLTPPPKCQNFVLLSANERTRGSCSFSLRERPAQDPWQSLATGGRAVGWNSEHQEEPLCSWPSQLQLWSCPSVPLLHVSGQAGLMWVFCKILLLVPTVLIWLGQGAFTNGFCFPALGQMVKIHRFSAAGPKDCTLLTLPLLYSSPEPSGSEEPINFQPLHYNSYTAEGALQTKHSSCHPPSSTSQEWAGSHC